MLTAKEQSQEFWMLTKGILQDSQVDTEEAHVVKRWLEEHDTDGEFASIVARIDKFLADGYVDRFESKDLIESIGSALRVLRTRQ